ECKRVLFRTPDLDEVRVGRRLPGQCGAAVAGLHGQLRDRWRARVVLERKGPFTARVASAVATGAGHGRAWVVGPNVASHGACFDLRGGVIALEADFERMVVPTVAVGGALGTPSHHVTRCRVALEGH